MCDFSKVPMYRLLVLLDNIEKQQIELEIAHKMVSNEINKRKPKVYKKEK